MNALWFVIRCEQTGYILSVAIFCLTFDKNSAKKAANIPRKRPAKAEATMMTVGLLPVELRDFIGGRI